MLAHPPSRILKLTRFLRSEPEAEVAPRGSRVSSPVLPFVFAPHRPCWPPIDKNQVARKRRREEGGGGEIETSGRVIAVVNESRERINKLKIPRSFARKKLFCVEKFGISFFLLLLLLLRLSLLSSRNRGGNFSSASLSLSL